MRTLTSVIVLAFVVAAAVGCASTPDSTGSWSRSYLLPRDRVMDAVIEVLEDEDYLVEANRKSGRFTGEPSRSRDQQGPVLTVRVDEKKGRIRVDVQTSLGHDRTTTTSNRDQSAVLEFLHALDQKLRVPSVYSPS